MIALAHHVRDVVQRRQRIAALRGARRRAGQRGSGFAEERLQLAVAARCQFKDRYQSHHIFLCWKPPPWRLVMRASGMETPRCIRQN
jgi:hypothetical protein